MEESTSKEKVLKEVRNALISKLENPFAKVDFNTAVFPEIKNDLTIHFAEQLIESGGHFIYCQSETHFQLQFTAVCHEHGYQEILCTDDQLSQLIQHTGPILTDNLKKLEQDEPMAGITRCESLIARYGSVMVSSKQGHRLNFSAVETHMVMAYSYQIVAEIKDAFRLARKKYAPKMPAQLSLITGPSRTADIEKTLITGMHGPRQLIVFLIDQQA